MLSQRILEVIMRPYGLKRASRSCWVMFLGKPDTYKLAPLIASELGLAYDTYINKTYNNEWYNNLLYAYICIISY